MAAYLGGPLGRALSSSSTWADDTVACARRKQNTTRMMLRLEVDFCEILFRNVP
jgi:hypothetical protein